MVVGFLLDTVVGESVDHLGWSYCMMADRHVRTKWEIIAQERYVLWKTDRLGEKGSVCGGASAWDYQVYPERERAAATPYIIPDQILAQLEEEQGGKYAAAAYLQEQRYTPLETLIESFLDQIERERGQVDAIVTYPRAVKSLSVVAMQRGVRLFVYEAGPLRLPVYHGTAFFCEGASVHWTEDCQLHSRYRAFRTAGIHRFFTRKELLALLLQDTYLPYLRLCGAEKQWDMLICGNWALDELSKSRRTILELLRTVRETYGDKFWFRPDPGDPFHADFGLPEERVDWGKPNVLSLARSRHVAANYGNILADALLWGATVHCMESKWHLYDWCVPSIQDSIKTPASDEAMNFYFLSFLVPMELATTDRYVRWRLSNPEEPAIYQRHLRYYLARYGLDLSLLNLTPEESLAQILTARNAPAEFAATLMREEGESLEDYWKRAETLAAYQRPETTEERVSRARTEAHNARLSAAAAETRARNAGLRADTAEAETRDARLRTEAAEAEARNAWLRTEAAEAETRDARLRTEAAEAETRDMRLRAETAEWELEAILRSRCWRITGPIRKTLDWIKARLRRR